MTCVDSCSKFKSPVLQIHEGSAWDSSKFMLHKLYPYSHFMKSVGDIAWEISPLVLDYSNGYSEMYKFFEIGDDRNSDEQWAMNKDSSEL